VSDDLVVEQKRLAIVGSREGKTIELVIHLVDCLAELPMLPNGVWPVQIVSGGATGPDTWAANRARELGVPVEELHPDYERYGGQRAPKIRNRGIAQLSHCGAVFWNAADVEAGAESGGTANVATWLALYRRRLRIFTSRNTTADIERLVDDWFRA
jgi:hypothetical protein